MRSLMSSVRIPSFTRFAPPATLDIDDLDADSGAAEFEDNASRTGKKIRQGAELRKYNEEMAALYGYEKKNKGLAHLYLLIRETSRLLGHWFLTDISQPLYMLNSQSFFNYGNADFHEDKVGERTITTLGMKIRKVGEGDNAFIERSFSMRGLSGRISSTGDQRESDLAAMTEVFRKFFPTAKFGYEWSRNENGALSGPLKGEETYTVNEILVKTMNMPKDIRQKSEAYKVNVPSQFIKHWGKLIEFTLRLGNPVYYGTPGVNTQAESGMTDPSSNINFTVGIDVKIKFPMEGAEWITSCDDPDDFSLLTFFHHIRNFETNELSGQTRKSKIILADKSASPMTSVRAMSDFTKVVGRVPPRQNDQGYTILPSGAVIFTGLEPDMQRYIDGEKDSYDVEAGQFIPAKVLESTAANALLAIDWQGNAMITTGPSGRVEFTDLQGAQALKDYEIGVHLHEAEFSTAILSNLYKWAGVRAVAVPKKTVKRNGYSAEVFMPPLEIWQDLEGADYSSTRDIMDFRESITKLYEKFDQTAMPIFNRIRYRYLVELFAHYARPENAKKYTDAYVALKEQNNGVVDPQKPVQTFNMPGLKHFYPHQTKVLSDLQSRLPENLLLGVDAGGGKTAMFVSLVANYVASGKVKRPLIVTPANLTPQFAEMIKTFTQQGWCVFPLYRSSWDRMHQMLGISLAQLREIIEAQPKNTIFLTNYNFLKLRPRSIRVGYGGEQKTFGFAVWASQIFDMVVADESHKVKTIENRAIGAAFRTLTPYAKVKALGSGTTIFNNPRDLMGQASTFSPAIFGDDISDYEEYAGKLAPDKVQAFTSRLSNQVKTINVNKREWAFLLPKIEYFQHEARMPKVMQAKYESIFKVLMEELQAELVRAKIDVNDEKNDELIMAKAKKQLVPLEVFINAPDCFVDAKDAASTNTEEDQVLRGAEAISREYLMLGGVKNNKELWKSPKIDVMDKLISEHFRKTTAKVIVMSYNLAISRHVMRHSKHVGSMLHYTAEAAKDSNLVKEFMENPKYKILVADENTIKEGFNLQIASRLIRLQTVYTVGEYQQALARVERPDDINPDGSLKYGRESIVFDWIVTSPSVDVLKTARLFVKIMEKTRVEEYRDNPRYRAWMEGRAIAEEPYNGVKFIAESGMNVPQLMAKTGGKLSLNPDTFALYDTFEKLQDYQELYALYNKWVDLETKRSTMALKRAISEETGIPIDKLTDNKLRLAAIRPPVNETIPGSKPFKILDGFVPFVRGVAPPDPYNLGLIPVAEAQPVESLDDDDNDAETLTVSVDLHPGDVVITEFGVSQVNSVRKDVATVSVDIPDGKGVRTVRVGLAYVFIPEKDKDRKRLEDMYDALVRARKPTTTLSFDSSGAVSLAPVSLDPKAAVAPVQKLKTIVEEEDEDIDSIVEPPTPRVAVPVNVGRTKLVNRPSVPATPRSPIAPAKPKPPVAAAAPARQPIKPPVRTPVQPVAQPQRKPERKPSVNMQVAMVNNHRCLMVFPTSKGDYLENLGFKHIGLTVSARIHTWQGLNALMTYLDDHFVFDQEHLDAMETQLEAFKTNPGKMMKSLPQQQTAFVRKFLIENTKVQKNPKVIYPFLVTIDNELAIVINCDVSKSARTLKGRKAVRGVDMFVAQEDVYMKFYPTLKALEDDVFDEIDPKFTCSNIKEFGGQLQGIPEDKVVVPTRAAAKAIKAPTPRSTPAPAPAIVRKSLNPRDYVRVPGRK